MWRQVEVAIPIFNKADLNLKLEETNVNYINKRNITLRRYNGCKYTHTDISTL